MVIRRILRPKALVPLRSDWPKEIFQQLNKGLRPHTSGRCVAHWGVGTFDVREAPASFRVLEESLREMLVWIRLLEVYRREAPESLRFLEQSLREMLV